MQFEADLSPLRWENRACADSIHTVEFVMDSYKLDIHLISDATGDTLSALARAAVAQFDDAAVTYHRWSLIRSRLQLHRVLEGIQAEPGPVLCSLVDEALRGELDSAEGGTVREDRGRGRGGRFRGAEYGVHGSAYFVGVQVAGFAEVLR